MQSNVRSLIAAKVRGEMARQGKSQRELSTALEIDQGSTSLRLQGLRSFRAEELVRVANWLGVPVSQFVDQDGPDACPSTRSPRVLLHSEPHN